MRILELRRLQQDYWHEHACACTRDMCTYCWCPESDSESDRPKAYSSQRALKGISSSQGKDPRNACWEASASADLSTCISRGFAFPRHHHDAQDLTAGRQAEGLKTCRRSWGHHDDAQKRSKNCAPTPKRKRRGVGAQFLGFFCREGQSLRLWGQGVYKVCVD